MLQIFLSSTPPLVPRASCSCAIGQSQCCGHITGTLYLVAHYKTRGMRQIPEDVLKTSLPQTWHIPRTDKIHGMAVQEVQVNRIDLFSHPNYTLHTSYPSSSPCILPQNHKLMFYYHSYQVTGYKKDRIDKSRPVSSTLYNPLKQSPNYETLLEKLREDHPDCNLLTTVPPQQVPTSVQTKFGLFPKGDLFNLFNFNKQNLQINFPQDYW